MSGAQLELFSTRPPTSDTIHALLPNMAYACYETILTVGGHFEMGTSNFEAVTCEGCRSEGVEAIRVRMRRQMGQCVVCAERLNKRDECPGGCVA